MNPSLISKYHPNPSGEEATSLRISQLGDSHSNVNHMGNLIYVQVFH
jgi:hypothetical protein